MSDWYQTVVDEWRARALVVLPEITESHLFTVVQSLKLAVISEAIKAGQGDTDRVPPPYLFLKVGVDSVAQDQDPSATYKYLSLTAWYVTDETTAYAADATLDTPAYCRSRLDLLRLDLQGPTTLTTCSWMGEDGDINSSEEVAFASQNLHMNAAELSFDKGFLTRLT